MLTSSRIVPWDTPPKPFVKWAGGKGQLLDELKPFFPEKFGTYFEPFLGGGAVFFSLLASGRQFDAVLSDTNEELITSYNVIKDEPEQLISTLVRHKDRYKRAPEDYFYAVRESEPTNNVEIAARLIFLNKTCFNGLYRVNSKGKFNVPFGRYRNPAICDKENLKSVSSALCWFKAKIVPLDYLEAAQQAKKGDFVYFDPPYQPVSKTANFTGYTQNGFSARDQEKLARLCKELSDRGCKVLVSNSNTEDILSLYADTERFVVKTVAAMRAINCKGNLRTGHSELIIKSKYA